VQEALVKKKEKTQTHDFSSVSKPTLSVHLRSIGMKMIVHFAEKWWISWHCLWTTKLSKTQFLDKIRSHSTIYTFKSYFAIVFSVISFQFLTNKQYLNRHLDAIYILIFLKEDTILCFISQYKYVFE